MGQRDKFIRSLQHAIETEGCLIRELHKQQRVYISRDYNMQPEHVFIGKEKCEHSPTKTHVYDLQWDPEKVRCLYEPDS